MEKADIDDGRLLCLSSEKLVPLRRKNRVFELGVEILERASAYFTRENVLPE